MHVLCGRRRKFDFAMSLRLSIDISLHDTSRLGQIEADTSAYLAESVFVECLYGVLLLIKFWVVSDLVDISLDSSSG